MPGTGRLTVKMQDMDNGRWRTINLNCRGDEWFIYLQDTPVMRVSTIDMVALAKAILACAC